MEVYGVVLVIALTAVSFAAGMKIANWYHRKADMDIQYALEKQYLRLRAGTDFNDPVGPYLCKSAYADSTPAKRELFKQAFTPAQLSQFEAGLKDNGSATILLKKPHNKKNEKENENYD